MESIMFAICDSTCEVGSYAPTLSHWVVVAISRGASATVLCWPKITEVECAGRSKYNAYGHNDDGVNECCIGLSGRSILMLSSFIPVADRREIGKIVELSADAIMSDVGEKIGFNLSLFKFKSSHNILRRVQLLSGELPKYNFEVRLLLLLLLSETVKLLNNAECSNIIDDSSCNLLSSNHKSFSSPRCLAAIAHCLE